VNHGHVMQQAKKKKKKSTKIYFKTLFWKQIRKFNRFYCVKIGYYIFRLYVISLTTTYITYYMLHHILTLHGVFIIEKLSEKLFYYIVYRITLYVQKLSPSKGPSCRRVKLLLGKLDIEHL
jgi:hypothetical protein